MKYILILITIIFTSNVYAGGDSTGVGQASAKLMPFENCFVNNELCEVQNLAIKLIDFNESQVAFKIRSKDQNNSFKTRLMNLSLKKLKDYPNIDNGINKSFNNNGNWSQML